MIEDFILSKTGIAVILGIIVGLSLLVAYIDAKEWKAFSETHRCVQTAYTRDKLISVKPVMYRTEHLYKCDNGERWR